MQTERVALCVDHELAIELPEMDTAYFKYDSSVIVYLDRQTVLYLDLCSK